MKLSATLLLLFTVLFGVAPVPASACAAHVADFVDLVDNGPAGNRITIVLIGDGYTAAELPRFRAQAQATWRAISSVEPFRSYARFFDVRRVDLVSPHSGIGVGSPLGMHFGCGGTPRLLCADDDAVDHWAGPATGPRYVIALADSTDYGGAGGRGVTTLSGGAADATRIIEHEMGHTVGGLGDEYDAAPGGDAAYPNLSDQGADAMAAAHAKWWRWLGAADPSGGVVGAYRGANGLYRPTQDSIMRTLGGVYNLPCREAIIESLYRQLRPLDALAPTPQAGPVRAGRILRVRPLLLPGYGRRLTVSWTVDGRPAPSRAVREGGLALDTGALGLRPRAGVVVRAVVTDETSWVRDEAFRRARMQGRAAWPVGRS
ncbi:M64 family metallopeptidase [Streptacidiphilus neutrinimicus]|uniref:M64 family metallopeptidase n=1 Tax=Streptacidiphilus neutrinimicus TaxID=105420 RepID=UPI000695069E|nr:M64 family metallopeptidase [Streptacidiphilus neutrinimicus]